MIKQTLMFTTPVSLSLKDQQMVITFRDNKETVTRPIEDIGFGLFVFFDLPVVTKIERKIASAFRKNLMKDGFVMLQFSSLRFEGEPGCSY